MECVPPHLTVSYHSTQDFEWSAGCFIQCAKEVGTVYIILPDRVLLHNP